MSDKKPTYSHWTPAQRKRARELPTVFVLLEKELHQLGLVATAQKLHATVQEIGWDIARHEER